MENSKKVMAIMIDYEYCTGCHACEIACKKEQNLQPGQFGIEKTSIGPWKIDENRWEWTHIPVITKMCNLCPERVAMGKVPSCVHHCPGYCMYYGPAEELVAKMTGKTRSVLFVPQQN